MSKETPLVLPVVIVGKDRTRMTCAVIDHIKEHVKNAKPYFICVSDRSRAGHETVVENHLKDIGETGYQVLRTLPEENRYGWGCAINIGLDCAFDVCKDSDFALVVDNDWLLQRDLDIDKYGYAFAFSNMGAITFKSVNAGTNVALTEKTLADGSTYLFRTAHVTLSRFSFTAEIGCMLITRQMRREYRQFKENCKTDETEWDFCNWYNRLTCEDKNDKHLWFANDRDMYHTELNGEGHVFTHVGLHSQHEGPHKWQVPEQYLYLSDDDADAKLCHDAYWIHADSEDTLLESDEIDWSKYFDRVYVQFFCSNGFEKMERLKEELGRVGLLNSNVLEWDYGTESPYDEFLFKNAPKGACISKSYVNHMLQTSRILKRAQAFGYRRIMILEDDVAFLKDKGKILEILDAMPKGYDCIQMDKSVNSHEVSLYREMIETQSINDFFFASKGYNFGLATCNVFTAAGIDSAIEIMDRQLISSDRIARYNSDRWAVATDNLCVQVLYKSAVNLTHSRVSQLHEIYGNQGIDSEYSLYNVPRGYCFGRIFEPGKAQLPDRCANKKGRKFVSVYAIARNEASVAERWYECAKEADEVCVLVNNSTDDTADILRRLGANVTIKNYDDWSFAVARNDSMSLVSPESEILFTFDLDETIAPGWRKKLEDAWIAEEEKGNKPVSCLYKYIWSFRSNGKEAQSFSVSKIHANGHGKWKYRCHELLTDLQGHRFFLNDFVVEHHQNTGTNRSKYLGLLQKDAADLPQDDRVAFYYARELMYEGQWARSIEEHKRHLSLPSARWKAERAASMRNIATCYENLKSPAKQELWLWKAAAEDPNHREAYFRLGQMFLASKDYKSALDALAKCIAIKEPSLEYISPPIVWSGYPHFLFSQALWWNGDWDGAVREVEKAVAMEPHNKEFLDQLNGMKATKAQHNR